MWLKSLGQTVFEGQIDFEGLKWLGKKSLEVKILFGKKMLRSKNGVEPKLGEGGGTKCYRRFSEKTKIHKSLSIF